MIISRQVGGGAPYTDPARLAAQVVTGIGFLGAGVILRARGSVQGLTTAATIFVVGAVGIAAGEGLFAIGGLATVLIIFVLVVLRKVERAVVQRRRYFHYAVKTRNPEAFLERLLAVLAQEHLQLEDFSVRDLENDEHEVRLSVITSLARHSGLIAALPELGTEVQSSTQAHID
jgi:putative Mg2+ transporter-C (MgtC) family protein